MSCDRIRGGTVTRFNVTTWWGRVVLDHDQRAVDFHGTSYRGASQTGLPRKNQRVLVIFSDATCERLLSVESA